MKVLLLQDQVYLPSLGGGNKSNRLLLEDLASRGHECLVFCPALTTRAGPTTHAELVIEITRRDVQIRWRTGNFYVYSYNGVHVEALGPRSRTEVKKHVRQMITRFQPDHILVSDDKRRVLLSCAVRSACANVVQIVQTVVHLPFGPLSYRESSAQLKLMKSAHQIIAISQFVQKYIKNYGKIDSAVAHLPVYGVGPFANLNNFDRGFVTLINPCLEKGLEIFLQLASHLPEFRFAVVPTWGTDDNAIRSILSHRNIDILPPGDDLDHVWRQTRVLVVPSIWFETFGYVVVEAMLRGIPVIASDIGGIPEAKLGVDYLVPVRPAARRNGELYDPGQDLEPWLAVLNELLSNKNVYDRCSIHSRDAANNFLQQIRLNSFSSMLESMDLTRG